MTVYAAGFARTEAAAQRLEEGSDARRRPAPASAAPSAEPSAEPVGAVASNVSTNAKAKDKPNATPTSEKASDKLRIASAPTTQTGGATTKPTLSNDASVVASAPAPVAVAPAISAPTTTASASTPATTPIPAPVTAPVSAPVAPPATTTTSTPATVPPAAPTPSTKPATLTDGTYTGWGSSRHGDIEATVVIEGGKITGAIISRCLTQYSCSWVAHLQAQVVTRQSPEVDNVSGATQSANAFYYAVIDALKKAK